MNRHRTPRKQSRLIACQGAAQLVTAVAAAACRESAAGRDWRGDDNILVIHDLYSPTPGEFDQAIRTVAGHLADWNRVVSISPERMRELKSLVARRGADAGIREARALVGADRVDSIYLCRNWQFGSELLLNAYRDAEKICYGDGVGLYSGRKTHAAGTGWRMWAEKLRRLASRTGKHAVQEAAARLLFGAGQTRLAAVEFNAGYLADMEPPPANGRPPMPTHIVDATWQRRVIDQLAGIELPGLARLREQIRGRQCLVLLGESLSESGAASPASEVALLGDIVRRLNPQPSTLLLYKPHPRDNPQKVREIAASLGPYAAEVHALDGGALPFLPFELLFASVLREAACSGAVQIWTGGYTAMGLAHLFGAQVNYGIGEELIRRHFAPAHVAPRIELEAYMHRQLERLLPPQTQAA